MGETSEHEFRRAMRSLCSAVSIISAGYKGKQFGMTATAVTSVSMTPPSLLVCINKSARIRDPPLGCRRFCVNVLHAQHRDLASTFSNKAIDNHFASGQWAIDALGTPYLVGAQANVTCDVDDTHSYGTHTIVIGKVDAITASYDINALLYQDGKYTVALADGVDWIVPIAVREQFVDC